MKISKRYSVKWNNGYWKVFDTVEYTDITICKLRSEAELTAARFNSQFVSRETLQ